MLECLSGWRVQILKQSSNQTIRQSNSLICLVPVVKTIIFGGYGAGVHLFPFRAEGCRACRGNREVCSTGSQAMSPYGARQKPRIADDTALVSFAHVSSSRQSSCKHGSALDFRNGCGKVGRRQFFLEESQPGTPFFVAQKHNNRRKSAL